MSGSERIAAPEGWDTPRYDDEETPGPTEIALPASQPSRSPPYRGHSRPPRIQLATGKKPNSEEHHRRCLRPDTIRATVSLPSPRVADVEASLIARRRFSISMHEILKIGRTHARDAGRLRERARTDGARASAATRTTASASRRTAVQ